MIGSVEDRTTHATSDSMDRRVCSAVVYILCVQVHRFVFDRLDLCLLLCFGLAAECPAQTWCSADKGRDASIS